VGGSASGTGVKPRLVRRSELGLADRERVLLVRHASPRALQVFINAIPINHELRGDTCHTVRDVLRYRRAHCIEAALVAACALWLNGEPPLIFDMRAERDYDHVVALFRRGGLWGAIAKSNHVALRGRDPVYRTLRELALSYFHEYHNNRGEKSLREYSRAFDLRTMHPREWVSGSAGAWEVERRLDLARHYRLFPRAQSRYLSPIDAMEWKAKRLVEYPHPHRRR
jgi:hypothetical protein